MDRSTAPLLSDDLADLLIAAAAEAQVTPERLLRDALDRELGRRARIRAALRRNRIAAAFPDLVA